MICKRIYHYSKLKEVGNYIMDLSHVQIYSRWENKISQYLMKKKLNVGIKYT